MSARALLCGALLLSACWCEEDAAVTAEGFIRCHLADPPDEREWVHGDLSVRIEGRTLTVEGLPETFRIAVATGPASEVAPEAELIVYLGDLVEAPAPAAGLTLLVAGGTDEWDAWTGRPTSDGVVDATVLRLVRVGPIELVPVPGAPSGRYARTAGSCGVDDASPWDLDAPAPGVHRILLTWAAPRASGLLGIEAGSALVATIEARVRAEEVIFAWPRLDPRSVRPASGLWVTRADGSREAPGWTLWEAGEGGITRLSHSP